MERLTYRVNTGIQDVVLTDSKSVEECLEWENVLERLAEYEDIGLTPEQLREIDKLYAEKCKELADAKLLKLPCAVGDTVYVLWNVTPEKRVIHEAEVREIRLGTYMARKMVKSLLEQTSKREKIIIFYDDDCGKTVFLTREEAEAALKEAERRQEGNETD